jgi:hypothetical protein
MHAVHDLDPDAYSTAVGKLTLPEDSTHLRPPESRSLPTAKALGLPFEQITGRKHSSQLQSSQAS